MGAFDDWFDPRKLFRAGYPEEISSVVRVTDVLRQALRAELDALAPEAVLEIGPGDAPVVHGRPGAVLMDLAPAFLRKLDGPRVVADLFAPPFAPMTFDAVVAVDVLTHVRPARRRRALESMAALGRDMIYLNPERGTREVADSPVPQTLVRACFMDRGYRLSVRTFHATNEFGKYPIYLTTARRA